MLHHIDRLKERPEHHRRAVAVGVSGLITSVIALTWFASLSGKLASFQDSATANARWAQEATSEVVRSQGLQVSGETPAQILERFRMQVSDLNAAVHDNRRQ